jgi:penicillin-binding protein 1C
MTLHFPGLDPVAPLPLALGGVGTNLWDLTQAYVALASAGEVRPLHVIADAPVAQPERATLLSPTAAWYVTDILAETTRPGDTLDPAFWLGGSRIAYKTGTSYGYRDAWAAGHGGGYTVIAWVGRADGASRPGETGRKAAAPVLMDAFDMLARFDPKNAAPERSIEEPTPAMARLAPPRRQTPPEIIFPRDGVELYGESFESDARGFSLAGRGGAGGYRWYVGGDPVAEDRIGGRAVWRPHGPGFYEITVVDSKGRTARAKVRVADAG